MVGKRRATSDFFVEQSAGTAGFGAWRWIPALHTGFLLRRFIFFAREPDLSSATAVADDEYSGTGLAGSAGPGPGRGDAFVVPAHPLRRHIVRACFPGWGQGSRHKMQSQ